MQRKGRVKLHVNVAVDQSGHQRRVGVRVMYSRESEQVLWRILKQTHPNNAIATHSNAHAAIAIDANVAPAIPQPTSRHDECIGCIVGARKARRAVCCGQEGAARLA